jgi:segregation and condensation protein A
MREKKKASFEAIYSICENRIHAIFTFLAMLELVQQKYLTLLVGTGRNNFILEWNENRQEDIDFDIDTIPKASDNEVNGDTSAPDLFSEN